MDIKIKNRLYKENLFIKNNKLIFILYTILLYPFPVFADGITEWSTATTSLITAIRAFAPQIILLGIVCATASAIIWICFPVAKKYTAWAWGVIGMIIVVSIFLNFYGGPIKNSFGAILDPLKNLLPS